MSNKDMGPSMQQSRESKASLGNMTLSQKRKTTKGNSAIPGSSCVWHCNCSEIFLSTELCPGVGPASPQDCNLGTAYKKQKLKVVHFQGKPLTLSRKLFTDKIAYLPADVTEVMHLKGQKKRGR